MNGEPCYPVGVEPLVDLIPRGEDRILSAFRSHARDNGYFRFAPHDAEGWRPTVRGFSGSLVRSLRNSPSPAGLTADDVGRDDDLSAFGVVEARRHRLAGMPLGIFLGILKSLRHGFLEQVRSAGFPPEEEAPCALRVNRFFDRNEIAASVAWTLEGGFERTSELARKDDEAMTELRRQQAVIVRAEKMASIGWLASGVARETAGPVGVVRSNLLALGKHLGKLAVFLQAQSECIVAGAKPEHVEAVRLKRAQLRIDYLLPDVDDLVRESLEGTERIRSILSDLKGFSHTGESGFRREDINGCVRRAIHLAGTELQRRATVRVELGDIPPTRCDPGRMDAVFRNLLLNAAHAIEGQGVVTVRSWREDGFLCVSVADTGCGIPEENLDRVFDPFFTTREAGRGAGLGLSIACDNVYRHGGTITVRSEVGRGATFTVRIPIVEEA
ncbi:MAG TPA: ATP-binding protein [Candidatus Deferrimicrobiaceae bacterium]